MLPITENSARYVSERNISPAKFPALVLSNSVCAGDLMVAYQHPVIPRERDQVISLPLEFLTIPGTFGNSRSHNCKLHEYFVQDEIDFPVFHHQSPKAP